MFANLYPYNGHHIEYIADLVVYGQRMYTEKRQGENTRLSGFSFSQGVSRPVNEGDGEPIGQLGEIYFQGVTMRIIELWPIPTLSKPWRSET